jgi:hypothetical protein
MPTERPALHGTVFRWKDARGLLPRCFLAVMLLALLLAAGAVPAAQRWEGSIQGLACVTQGKVCPINMEDPLIALEKTFVLLTAQGAWYYLPNLDRGILARHLNRPVAVVGVLEPGSKAIMVDKLFVRRGKAWREAWSQDMERELLEQLDRWGRGKRE